MINLRHLFFILVGFNLIMLIVFLNLSLDSKANQDKGSLPITNLVSGDGLKAKLVADKYIYTPEDVIKLDTQNSTVISEIRAPEVKKDAKIDKFTSNLNGNKEEVKTAPEPVKPVVNNINFPTLKKGPKAAVPAKTVKAKKTVQKKGVSQVTDLSDLTISELHKLNDKIKADPQLTQFLNQFKTLKKYYENLQDKYDELDADFDTMQKGAMDLTKKHTQLRNWYDNKKVAYDKKIIQVEELNNRTNQVATVMRLSNPFYLLGAYPEVTLDYFNSYPDGRPFYEKKNYGLYNDNDYCETVDFYNLAHPENMLRKRNFFTDYAKNGLARTLVMRKIGFDLSSKVSRYMPKPLFWSRSFHLDPRINAFFTKRVDLHIYHEMGKHFMCATQMYNHIPGHGVLKRKDMIVDSVDTYAAKYVENEQCFNKHKFFPFSYRLYLKEECQTFFTEINSKEYIQKSLVEPIQYLVKVGYGAHRAMGVFLLDANQTSHLKAEYDNGAKCGALNKSLIVQTYITNPLLLDFNNKFDFRIYMLVASTNPLIAFYHDGFLRVSLNTYDKFSNDRSTHLTNTHLSKDIFADVKESGKTLNGMTEEELRNYQMWTLERLETYLLSSGKIKDPNWLNNYLRPKFREAFVHTIRMSAAAFWKGSNVFEMFGLDFMLDDELNLWFIECNSSPQLIGTNEHKTNFLTKMLKDLFEIQYAYYKSRMTRLLKVIKDMQAENNKPVPIDYTKWRVAYAEAAKNRLEPGFTIKETNGFVKIMDLNEKGADAYFGNLKEECVIEEKMDF